MEQPGFRSPEAPAASPARSARLVYPMMRPARIIHLAHRLQRPTNPPRSEAPRPPALFSRTASAGAHERTRPQYAPIRHRIPEHRDFSLPRPLPRLETQPQAGPCMPALGRGHAPAQIEAKNRLSAPSRLPPAGCECKSKPNPFPCRHRGLPLPPASAKRTQSVTGYTHITHCCVKSCGRTLNTPRPDPTLRPDHRLQPLCRHCRNSVRPRSPPHEALPL